MKTKDLFKVCFNALSRHKMRAFLTILGIVIGIASVSAAMGIGAIAQNYIVSQIQGLGANTLFVMPGTRAGFQAPGSGSKLTEKDYKDLADLPNVLYVDPIITSSKILTYNSEKYRVTLTGGSEHILNTNGVELVEGRMFTEQDVRSKNNVLIVTEGLKTDMFNNQSPIGIKLKINNKKYKIIGVAESNSSSKMVGELVYLPLTTMQQYITGNDKINQIAVKTNTEEDIPGVILDAERVLRKNHNIKDAAENDFNIQTLDTIMDTISSVTGTFTLLLTAISAISLVVGGIGIMNIMLVSVMERTKEIGLRKALGATKKDIANQFILEAIILTFIGGFIGVVLGITITYLFSLIGSSLMGFELNFVWPVQGILISLGVSSLIGLIFGYSPAKQASKKSPIEALRTE